MLGFLFAVVSLLGFGGSAVFLKKPVQRLGVFPAILTNYLFTSILTFASVLVFGSLALPSPEIALLLLATVFVGTIAIVAFFKAVEDGELSIVAPVAKTSVIVTVAVSMAFFGEVLTAVQAAGMAVVIAAAIAVGTEGQGIKRLERGISYSIMTAVGWGLFFAMLKPLVAEMGPFNAAFYTEAGIFALLVAFVVATKQKILFNADAAKGIFVRAVLLTVAAVTYNFAISLIGVAISATFIAASPAVIAILSKLYLKEEIQAYKYVGIAGIVVGLAMLALGQ